MTHTPAPWTAGTHIVYGPDDKPVLYAREGMTEANARLIAAAPDMLAALCEAQESLVVFANTPGAVHPKSNLALTLKAVRAAIAKATRGQVT